MHLGPFMHLPPLDPQDHLAWTWKVHHPGQSVPTIAEWGLSCGFTEGEAHRWLLRCVAATRAKIRRDALWDRLMRQIPEADFQRIMSGLEAK